MTNDVQWVAVNKIDTDKYISQIETAVFFRHLGWTNQAKQIMKVVNPIPCVIWIPAVLKGD